MMHGHKNIKLTYVR